MLTYKCSNCDNLECDTSICPVCGKRTELVSSEIYYCDHCNVPCFTNTCEICGSHCKKISTDIRPVFSSERLLIECIKGEPFCYKDKSIWASSGGVYYIDGNKIKISISSLKSDEINRIKTLFDNNFSKNEFDLSLYDKFVRANSTRLNEITDEAVSYIRKCASNFDLSDIFVSFSGGKDSTVTSHLVMRALETESVLHIYGDTTLEFPMTKKYIEKFRHFYRKTPVLVAKNTDQDFTDLCNVVGPPSRVLRWCCTVFKTGAITKKLESVFSDNKKILSFQGIRRSESSSRSKYDRTSESSKIQKQEVASPIIDWTDFDVWLYILSNKLLFNDAYKYGFTRVGCWCCPNNSRWSEVLSQIYMTDMYRKWHQTLLDFAIKTNKNDPEGYVNSGSWKARQGGNGLSYSDNVTLSWTPCVLEENAFNFDLKKPLDENIYTFFKPFGEINYEMGNKRLNEVFVVDKNSKEPLMKLSGKLGKNSLKVTVLKQKGKFASDKYSKMVIDNQLTKFQSCIACGYCQSVCRHNALKVMNANKGNVSNQTILYSIDTEKCVGCLECVTHFDGGCYMKKVLRIRKGD